MTNLQYAHATQTVSDTAAVLLTGGAPAAAGPVLIHNRGPVSVFVGGSSVTADQSSTGGLEIEPGEKCPIPAKTYSSPYTWELYAVTASGSSAVSWLRTDY